MKKLMIAAALTSILALVLGGAALAQAPARTVWDGVFTAEQATQGKVLFDTKCAICHGAEMNGAEMAPALAGGAFIVNWSGSPVAELASRIHTTMPANDPGSLSNQEVALVVAYILSFNQFPAGTTVLPSDEMAQKQINIVAEKPAGK
jgi:mono/diheme cytochrome c family protein